MDAEGAGMHPREYPPEDVGGKEMAVVAGEGSTIEHFEAIATDCGNWHNQRRADALVAMENAIRERCSRPRFLPPSMGVR